MPSRSYRIRERPAIWWFRQSDVDVLEVLPVPIYMHLRDHNFMDANGMAVEALGDFMVLCIIGGVIAASSVVVHTTLAIGAQGESASAFEQSYLYQATEGQQAEVALGQMAVQKASSDQVKQYGARMM